jgi:tripartite-type tricarboxylate transporter receptor subunit TctC
VLSGQVDFALVAAPTGMSLVRSGNLRALATTSSSRLPALPDVPTVAEQGFDGFEAYDWKALVAPVGIQAPIVARLNAASNKALDDPDMISGLQESSEPRGGTPEQVGRIAGRICALGGHRPLVRRQGGMTGCCASDRTSQ